jgi:hypothetical protein
LCEGLLWIEDVQLCVRSTASVVRAQKTYCVGQFTLDAENLPTPTVDRGVFVNAERCEGKGHIILLDAAAKLFRYRIVVVELCAKKVGGFCLVAKMNVSALTTRRKLWSI